MQINEKAFKEVWDYAAGHDSATLRQIIEAYEANKEPVTVSLKSCARLIWDNFTSIPEPECYRMAELILDAAGVKYVD